MSDFINGAELLAICKAENIPISQAMRNREKELAHTTDEEINKRLDRIFEIMNHDVHEPIERPEKSVGGLIGGEAKQVMNNTTNLSGPMMTKAIAYSLAVLEENATMGLIVAAPTAGSSGVLPGVLIAGMEERGFTREQFNAGILNAGALGYIMMRNASVSGAEAGCQAEIGSAAAMTASALVELMGGSPADCLDAASLALANLLGLVCDPIAGLVEAPCQCRNSIGAANAIISADLSLCGMKHHIPFDEMVAAMYRVGRSLPFALRESALGGCAGTPTGCKLRRQCVIGEEAAARLEPLLKA